MRKFSQSFLEDLLGRAYVSPRRRQHQNVHRSHDDPCQILFNAIGVDSYIRPHRHLLDPRRETLVAVRGSMVVLRFGDDGVVLESAWLAACDSSSKERSDAAVCVEVEPDEWHTVIAVEEGSVLLEVKAGPFDPRRPKEPAPWAPAEGDVEAAAYLRFLRGEALRT